MVLSGRRRALWVLPVADLGGVARHAADVARAGLPGWETLVVLPHGPAATVLREAGAEVLVRPVGPEHGLRRSVHALRAVVDHVRPAVVHSHLPYADVVAALARRRGQCLVTTEHGIAADDRVYHGTSGRAAVRARLHRWRLRRTHAFLAVSHATLEAARTKWDLPERLLTRVVPNGIDPVEPTPPRSTGLRVVSLARLAPEKRLPQLLEAFAVLAAQHPEAQLTLAGSGPLEHDLRALVRDRGLTGRVDLPGHVEAATALADADVLALLSVWENCSYAVLDALVRGVGAVTAPVGGNHELLPPECFVDPDDPTGVAAALAGQGLCLARRPALPQGWPTVGRMCSDIAEVYEMASA